MQPWRRYGARIFDLAIISVIYNLLVGLLGIHKTNPEFALGLLNPITVLVVSALAMIPVEAYLLHRYGATPGKWLFGLFLEDQSKSTGAMKSDISRFFRRAAAIWADGLFFGIPLLCGIALATSYFHLKRKGKTSWDEKYGFTVGARPLSIEKGIALTIIILSLFLLPAFSAEIWDKEFLSIRSKEASSTRNTAFPKAFANSGREMNSIGKEAVPRKTIDKAIRKLSYQLNRQLPVMVEVDTRWDYVAPSPGLRFTYYYTLVAVEALDINTRYFLSITKRNFKEVVCSDSDIQFLFENDVVLSFSFRGSNWRKIGTFDLMPRDCGYS